MDELKIEQKVSLVDQVEERLLEYFKYKNLKHGDSLPKELQLTKDLGVARSVLREALSRFRMIGLIESKPGRGMILKDPELFSGLTRIINPNLLSEEKLKDLLNFRVILEFGAVEAIFDRVTEEDIQSLEEILDYESKDWMASTEDRDFHIRLLSIAGNESVKQFQNIIYPLFEYVNQNINTFFSTYQKRTNKTELVAHRVLVDCLKNRDKENYRKALKEHLSLYL